LGGEHRLGVFARRAAASAGLVLLVTAAMAVEQKSLFEGSSPSSEWAERPLQLPSLPEERNLAAFPVSPAATARFLVDTSSLSFGDDGVWRFTLVIRTGGGAENISYEGIRCETSEKRLYATARGGGEWVPARNVNWSRIAESSLNRYHAALAKDYLCPPGARIPAQDEAIHLLRHAAPFP
jgi:hypothetical protein